jgi:predicted GNAT family acetyltransferase
MLSKNPVRDPPMPDENIQIRDNPEQTRFEAQIGDSIAIAQYRLSGKTMTFTHTEVPEALQGQGVGSSLVKAALEHARTQNYKVGPLCQYVAEYIQRHPEYADLVSARKN